MVTGRTGKGSGRRTGARAVALLLSACWLLSGCSPAQVPAPESALPEGAVLGGDAQAFRRVLAGVELLRGSPLARGAGLLRDRLASCREFSASLAGGDGVALTDLIDSASCDATLLEDVALRSLRGDAELVFVLPVGPIGEGGRIAGSARVDDAGSVVVEAEFLETPDGITGPVGPPGSTEPAGSTGSTGHWARLLAPDSGAAGPRRLSDEGALVSARVRPAGGLDLAALVPSGSQGDQMFRLKSGIFQGAALAGAWEFALYPPAEGRAMPLLALSADVRFRSAAVAGMREFIADLESSWPLRHQTVAFGEYAGACFFDLRILPEFAPCYADTADAIVIGWNPEAIGRALAGHSNAGALDVALAAAAAPELGEHAAELIVRFADLPAADDRLRGVLAPNAAPLQLDYFWDRLAVVSGRRKASAGTGPNPVWLRARLRAADRDGAAAGAGDRS